MAQVYPPYEKGRVDKRRAIHHSAPGTGAMQEIFKNCHVDSF